MQCKHDATAVIATRWEQDTDSGALVSTAPVPVAAARRIAAEYEAAGRECSWAPDAEDHGLAWLYLSPPEVAS